MAGGRHGCNSSPPQSRGVSVGGWRSSCWEALPAAHFGEIELGYAGRIENGVLVLMDFEDRAVSRRDAAVQDERSLRLADRAAFFEHHPVPVELLDKRPGEVGDPV